VKPARPASTPAADVPARPVLLAGLGLFVALILSGGLVAAMLGAFETERPGAVMTPQPVPPQPRLQTDPTADRAVIEAQARARLQGYAWVDRPAGRVRIPIEEAMRLTAKRGWPDAEAPR
jgi:hypothetical protein